MVTLVTADSILADMRFKLVTLIIILIRMIDAYKSMGKRNVITDGEGYVTIDFADCVGIPVVSVSADNTYLDVEHDIYTKKKAISITTSDDHDFYLSMSEDGEADIHADDLSIEELVRIAKILEETYGKE